MSNIFEKASRLKLRFGSPKGSLSVEDLWDLPLTSKAPNIPSLDDIAVAANKRLEGEQSFVNKRVTKTAEYKADELRLEIAIAIIETKQAESKEATDRTKAKQEKETLAEIIAEKEKGELLDFDLKELKKRYRKL